MLTVSQVTKSFHGRILFENASLQIQRGDRVGLVGPNGAGKSTLFRLILGEEEPDAGSIALQRGTEIGFLPQESAPVGEETTLEIAMDVSPEVSHAFRQMRLLKEAGKEDSHEAMEALESFYAENGPVLLAKARKILSGLAFRESDLDKPARTLSGGWIMRAHLARLLVMEPPLLMLDEPTNHLDLSSLGWFQNYLSTFPGAILMISHDRAFLNALCQSIIEISSGALHRYHGNYDAYVEQKEARREQHLAAYKNQQREIQRLQQFVDRFRAKASKAAQAQDRLKQLARIQRIAPPEETTATVKFRFPQPKRGGQKVITLAEVDHAYGNNVVYTDLHFTVERGQRTVLVGPNGAGKSTLIKLLAGVLPIQKGERVLGHEITAGYFSQQRLEGLNAKNTVLEEVLDNPHPVSEQNARGVLGSFLFRGDDVFKPVHVLSGGEKSRLALVKLLLNPPNFLLMDEPTTHLDMPSIDALVTALKQYEGTLIFVSHDVYFIRAIATTVLHIDAGKLTFFAGDYDYYLEKSQITSEREGVVAGSKVSSSPKQIAHASSDTSEKKGLKELKAQRRMEAEQRQAEARAKREAKARVESLEKQIVALEMRQKELVQALEDPEVHTDHARIFTLNRELADLQEQIASLTEAWEEAAI